MRTGYFLDRKDREEYAGACGAMRSMEKRLLGEERLDDLCALGDAGAVIGLLRRWEWTLPGGETADQGWEETLEDSLAASDRRIINLDPRPQVTSLLVMKYEMLNLSAYLKARALRLDRLPALHRRGTSRPGDLAAMVSKMKFHAYPEVLARELESRRTALAGGETRQIAATVAGSHHLALVREAKKAGGRLLVDYLRHWADVENIKYRLRALRHPAFWRGEDYSLPGGHLDAREIWGAEDESRLSRLLGRTVYGPVVERATDGRGRILPALLEREGENFLTDLLGPARYVALGPEPLWAYWHAREVDGKNIRAVVLGIRAGQDRESLRRQLRRSYV